MKRKGLAWLFGLLALLVAPVAGLCQGREITGVSFIAPGGDCAAVACSSATSTKLLCRNSTGNPTLYACDTDTFLYAPVASATVPGGASGQVQFNDGGSVFGGNPGLTYDKNIDRLSVWTLSVIGQGADVTGGIDVVTGVIDLQQAGATVDGKNLDNAAMEDEANTFTQPQLINSVPALFGARAGYLSLTSMTTAGVSGRNAGGDGPSFPDFVGIEPKYVVSGTSTVLGANNRKVILDKTGPGVVTGMLLAVQQHLFQRAWKLGALRIKVYHDDQADLEAASPGSGRPCVDVPLGYWMASGVWGADHSYKNSEASDGGSRLDAGWINSGNLGQRWRHHWSSLAHDQNAVATYVKLPQPFGSRIYMTVTDDQEAGEAAQLFYVIEYATGGSVSPNGLVLHAKYRQEFPATAASNIVATPTISGAGQFVGMVGTLMSDSDPNAFEGDWFVLVDGQTPATASYASSGSEEFWSGGWYWQMGMHAGELSGAFPRINATYGTYSALLYRWWPIPVRFTSSFSIEAQHGDNNGAGVNGERAYWAGASFWYATETGQDCATVTVPPWRPATASASTTGRMPPAGRDDDLPTQPANGLIWEAEAQHEQGQHVLNGSALSSNNQTVYNTAAYNASSNTMFSDHAVELRITDGAGANDYARFRYYVPSGAGLSSGVNTLQIYFGRYSAGGQFRVQYSTDAGTSFTDWTCSSGCIGGGQPNDIETYSATANIGAEQGTATGTVSVDVAEINVIRFLGVGKNASSSNYYLVADAWTVRP